MLTRGCVRHSCLPPETRPVSLRGPVGPTRRFTYSEIWLHPSLFAWFPERSLGEKRRKGLVVSDRAACARRLGLVGSRPFTADPLQHNKHVLIQKSLADSLCRCLSRLPLDLAQAAVVPPSGSAYLSDSVSGSASAGQRL